MIESEKDLEKKLNLLVKIRGGISLKIPAIHFKGIPDRVCFLPGGVVFFAEIKTTKKKPTKLQTVVQNRLRRLGFKVYVVDTTEKIHRISELFEIKSDVKEGPTT